MRLNAFITFPIFFLPPFVLFSPWTLVLTNIWYEVANLAGLLVLDLLEVGGGRGGVGADDGRVPTPLPPVEGDEGQQQHHDDDDDAADDAGGNVDLGAGAASRQVHQALAQL